MKPNTITRFGELIDPTKCRVESFPGLVAVFGGKLSDDVAKLHCSKRNVFIKWLERNQHQLVTQLVIPENYQDWNGLGKYDDLLAFEQDLGHLTDAVIVFLEGPGSFAELGAFSQIDSLASKLVVVIASEHHQNDSFISLGPVRQLRERFDFSVCTLPSTKPEELEADIGLIFEKLKGKQTRKNLTEAFQAHNSQHQVLAALDLVDLFLAVTREELEVMLKGLGVDIGRNRIHQLLFLLEKVRLITRTNYGDQSFYLPSKPGKFALINYSSTTREKPFDRARWRTEVIQEIAAQGPRRRVCETNFGKERFQSWTS